MFPKIDFSQLTLMDALDVAILVEIEALDRYILFTEQLGHRYPEDAASVFRMMAKNEKKHADELSLQRKKMFADAPVNINKDDLFDVEAPDISAIRWNMSPFKAFQLVLLSEEKACDFYAEALTYVSDNEVKKLFAELRDEEGEHVRMIKEFIANLPPEAHIDLEDED